MAPPASKRPLLRTQLLTWLLVPLVRIDRIEARARQAAVATPAGPESQSVSAR